MPKISIVNDLIYKNLSVFPVHSIDANGNCTCGNVNCNVKNKGKHPATVNGCKDASSDSEIIKNMFPEGSERNVGIATGAVSQIIVFDVDDPEKCKDIMSILPKTWKVKTGRGFHYYFQWEPRFECVKNSKLKNYPEIDIRANGGYVLASGSKHHSGVEYSWVTGPEACELANVPEWLWDLLPKREPEPVPVQSAKKHNVETIQASDVHARAKAFLKKCPPALTGNSGHSHTFKTICRVIELFGNELDNDDVFDVLHEWNERCIPAWNASELMHKIQDARKHVGNPDSGNADENVHHAAQRHDDEDDDDFPVLHADALQGLPREIVRAIEPETEADATAILVSLLTFFGHAIGNHPHFKVGSDSHCCNMFTALVGDTASGKGMATNIVQRLFRGMDISTCHGLSSGEGLVEKLADGNDEDENVLTFGAETKKLLCIETEFSRPITAMRREGNTLSPILRSAWDRQTLEIATRGKSKLRASNNYVSILAHITPDELKKILEASIETSNGFSNRFLWVLVRSTKDLPHGGNVNVIDAFQERLTLAVERARGIGSVERSPQANALWEQVYRSLKGSKPGAFGRSIERARAYVLRLSLTYALFDGSDVIELEHVRAALALWEYCSASAERIFSTSDNPTKHTFEKRLQKLVRYVQVNPGCSKTSAWNGTSKRMAASDVDSLIAVGVSRHLIRIQDEKLFPVLNVPDDSRKTSGDVGYVGCGTQSTSSHNPTDPTYPTSHLSPNGGKKEMPLCELIQWTNSTSQTLEMHQEGICWVTQQITPWDKWNVQQIEAAMHSHQDILKTFVKTSDVETSTKNDRGTVTLTIDGKVFTFHERDFVPDNPVTLNEDGMLKGKGIRYNGERFASEIMSQDEFFKGLREPPDVDDEEAFFES